MGGTLGGLAGAAAAHTAVIAAFRYTGDAGIWFKGPHGPPFFSLLVNTSLLYLGIGAGLCAGRRLMGAAAGFMTSFLLIYAPLAAATRIFTWGEGPEPQPTMAWVYLILGVYVAASVFTIAVLGAAADRTWTRPGVLRRVLGALAGAAFAYVLDLGLSRLFPAFRAMVPAGWVPQPAALADGLLTGGFMGLGIACMSPSFSPDS
ncbi:MAG: hypothetical protein A2X36_15345 [Elusimicrobia bacterium GWA2_69_24]|nr:MAG: hypothetical protein A2X36_15345 [Elusimicrobia bacterium GWA2_69_24]HBL18078.1 hypothetical protein [Elusimicrobiota bacterium]